MQTFLPYKKSFVACAEALDFRRLGKQRVEAFQIDTILAADEQGVKLPWLNHPAVQMWKGFRNFLRSYYNCILKEWIKRGYNNTMPLLEFLWGEPFQFPSWIEDERLYSSHRANLLRKDPQFYGQYGWTEDPSTPYFWPTKEGY